VNRRRLLSLAIPVLLAALYGGSPALAGSSTGVGNVPQGTQSDAAYASSFAANNVTNVFATTQRVSCYRPEVPAPYNDGPNDGYTGESSCPGATTGEDIGTTPYPTQAGSNPGYPAATPMLVKDFSESDIRADPTNPNHLIGSSKWFVSPEGYNHLLGFYESWNGGLTWPVQGHIPGYEGWTDNTDPVGAFDGFGNYYEFILPYQFYYNPDGTHNFQINQNKEPNPIVPAQVVSMAVHPAHPIADVPMSQSWITTHNGSLDIVAPYDSKGLEPDKQWMAIDTNPSSPHYNRIYVMWVVFSGCCTARPFASFADARPDGSHTDWSTPVALPTPGYNPQGDSYLLPHIDASGNVYTPVVNTAPKKGYCCDQILLDKSSDGGMSYQFVSTVATNIAAPPFHYNNTTFRDGIEETFVVGPRIKGGPHRGADPLYMAWEDYSAGADNIILTASYDGGLTWSPRLQANDNSSAVDEFQPNLAAAANGTVSVAFYDRRLACPAAGTAEAAGAGLALDQVNPRYAGSLPPYGAVNYCVNSSLQFYRADLTPVGHNIRVSHHTWDPQLNSPHTGCAACIGTFIGDYFGNITSGSTNYTTSVSTYNDGSNPNNQQQQVIAIAAVP